LESLPVIVKWGLESLPEVLRSLNVQRPLLVSTPRWRELELPIERRFFGALPHAEVTGVEEAVAALEGADSLVALGGGSVIDTAKAVSSKAGELPIVSVPTTYSGAEWTDFYGVRDIATGLKSAGAGARVEAIVYDPELTMSLSAYDTCGAALNALAHCAEALYAPGRTAETDRDALTGAALISTWLPRVIADGNDREARRGLLEGAMHGGSALRAGMGLGHAMVQALGGGFGLPHGPMSAVCLPHALDFNRDAAAGALARLGEAMQADPIARACELGRLACPMRLRDYDIDEGALPATAEKIAVRPAARANPRPATPEQVLGLLQEAW
jgi:alcohol dehydrogenase class IV